METMKMFKKYLTNFIVLFLVVSGLTYYGMANYHKEEEIKIECIVETESPVIEVTKTTNKIIEGTVTNNTDKLMLETYIRLDFYNQEGDLIGTKYNKIKYFNVKEKTKFVIRYGYKNISTIKLSTTNTIE